MMRVKKQIWTEIESSRDFEDLPTNAIEFVKWLSARVNKAPEGFRDQVIFDVNHQFEQYDDWCTFGWEIGYWREETDEEYNDRLAEESRRSAQERLAQLSHERAMYQQLKKKFEA